MSPARKHTMLTGITIATDILAISISFLAAYHFRFFTGIVPVDHGIPEYERYLRALLVVLPVYIVFFKAYGLYQPQRHIRRIEEIFKVIKAVTFAVVILTASTFFYRGFLYSRIYLLLLWVFSILFVSVCRYILIQLEYRRKLQKKDLTRVLLIGADANARSIIQWSRSFPHYGQQIVGVLAHDPGLIGKHLEGIEILGSSLNYEKYLDELKPERVVLVDPSFTRQQIADLVVDCEDKWIEFKIAADFYGMLSRSVDVEYISRVPLLGFRQLPLDDLWNRMIKRTFDLIVTSILVIATMPIWAVCAILIKLDDGGPIFYSQERVGRDQKVFNVLKFRTMRVNAETQTGPVWARKDDDRRTRTGNFMRRWNIDELPQLFNVLKGDMSLVGPRPERPHFVDQFRESIPRYMARHKGKSGITGWAQVNGYRGNTSISERIKYDLYYLENWSLLFDIEILFMTFFAFKNAY